MTHGFVLDIHMLLILSLPGITTAFLFVPFCVLRTWHDNHQVGDPKNMAQYIWPCGNAEDLKSKEKLLTSR